MENNIRFTPRVKENQEMSNDKEQLKDSKYQRVVGPSYSRSFKKIVFTIILLVTLLLLYKSALPQFFGAINKDSYYAVFLSNDQVYFGHIVEKTSSEVILSGVYYLQFDETSQNLGRSLPTPKFSLVKMGSEIHGPKDMLYLNREHVLFYEELKSDSQVVKSIQEVKN